MRPRDGKGGVPEPFRAWTETQWHYVSISCGNRLLGLLVETELEEEARREAEEICRAFNERASVLDVKRVVIQ